MKRWLRGQIFPNVRCESAERMSFRHHTGFFVVTLINSQLLSPIARFQQIVKIQSRAIHLFKGRGHGLASFKACSWHVLDKRSYLQSAQDRAGNLRSPVIHACVKAQHKMRVGARTRILVCVYECVCVCLCMCVFMHVRESKCARARACMPVCVPALHSGSKSWHSSFVSLLQLVVNLIEDRINLTNSDKRVHIFTSILQTILEMSKVCSPEAYFVHSYVFICAVGLYIIPNIYVCIAVGYVLFLHYSSTHTHTHTHT